MRKNTANNDIKTLFRHNDLYYWEVADHIGIAESTLLRWLRNELPADKKEILKVAVAEIVAVR